MRIIKNTGHRQEMRKLALVFLMAHDRLKKLGCTALDVAL